MKKRVSQILLLSFLTLLTSPLKFQKQNKTPFIIPFIKNKITPFLMMPESEYDKTNEYKITRTCTPSVIKNIKFEGASKNLCDGQGLYYHISYLNEFLTNLEASSKNEKIADDLIIIYNLEFKDSDGFERSKNFHQFIKVIREVPVIINSLKKMYLEGVGGSFREEILEVPLSYSYSHTPELVIDGFEDGMEEWMSYEFVDNVLYFQGNLPKDLERNVYFKFKVKDVAVELESDSYVFEFKMLEKIEDSKKGLHIGWIFFIVFLIVVCVLLFLYFFYRSKKNKEKIGKEFRNDGNVKKEVTGREEFNYNVYDGMTRGKGMDDTFEDVKNQHQENEDGIGLRFKKDFKMGVIGGKE